MIKLLILFIAIIFFICYILIIDKNPKLLIYSQMIYIIASMFLISYGAPSALKFLSDGINILILIYTLFAIKKSGKIYAAKPLIALSVFLIIAIISAVINRSNLLLFAWAMRNNCRAFIFFLGCIYLLDKEDIKNIFKFLDICVIISLFLALFQYFVMHLNQDRVGGILGIDTGVNASMNMLLCICITNKIIRYLNKEISNKEIIAFIFITMIIATISELKIYYIEFIAIFIIAIMMSKISKRTLSLIIGGIVILIVAINVLYKMYDNFENFFSIEKIIEYSKDESYDGQDSINRMSSIEVINHKILQNKTQKLLGIGTGKAEVSSISLLNSEFADKYNKTMAYVWFSQSILLIENGFIGLIVYTLMFLSFIEIKNIKNDNTKKFSFIISLLSILLVFYDASLRTNFAMVWFWALSVMYINNYKKIKTECSDEKS